MKQKKPKSKLKAYSDLSVVAEVINGQAVIIVAKAKIKKVV